MPCRGRRKGAELVRRLGGPDEFGLPGHCANCVIYSGVQFENLAKEIRKIARQLLAWHGQSTASQRLETIPGVGFITALAARFPIRASSSPAGSPRPS